MSKDEIEFTKTWWSAVCKDPARFAKWLQKLQITEIGGYTDHVDFLKSGIGYDERSKTILMNIADDEMKHSLILRGLMGCRGIEVIEPTMETCSSYWTYMNQQYDDLRTYAAINHFGEALAADRFEIILEHPDTDIDVRFALRSILPDEIFHRETLQRMAGEAALAKMKTHHDLAFGKLIGK